MTVPSTPTVIVTTESGIIQHDADEGSTSSGSERQRHGRPTDSDLNSLTESIKQHVFENGRRYHSFREGKYVLPNDEAEKDRLDLVHHLFLLLLNGNLHLAPLDNPKRILDMGTGTGIWALDMADRYPNALIAGNDLSPIQPEFVAPNTHFFIEDIEEEWTFPPDHFDYIHGRTLIGSIKDWPEVFASAFKHLKPGGWLELQEGTISAHCDDGSLKQGSNVVKYFELLYEASAATGRLMDIHDKLGVWMKEAGFINIRVEISKIPWRPWPKDERLKEIGRFQYHNCVEGIDSYGLALMTREAGYTTDEAKVFLALVRNEIRSKSLHAYNKLYVVYGQKPLE